MIAGLRGNIQAKLAGELLIDVGGVIYRVGTSVSSVAEAGDVGDDVYVHTHLVVREDQMALYGFLTPEELRIFETLIGVSGVGPRLGCAILGVIRPDALLAAIDQGNADLLATVPGIGKKTAARLIVELRGKLPEVGSAFAAPASDDTDVIAALRALGYSVAEANTAVNRLGSMPGTTVEERVVAALRDLSDQ